MLAREAKVLADVVNIQVDSSFPCIKAKNGQIYYTQSTE